MFVIEKRCNIKFNYKYNSSFLVKLEFTFENKKMEVPKTGDESKIKLFAGAIILSLLGITYIVIRNHNKNKQE